MKKLTSLLSTTFILTFCISISSCRKIEDKSRTSLEVEESYYLETKSPFVQDKSLDFFLENSWYAYDQSNHIIWPNFRVYGLRVDNQFYKFQIINYYNQASEAGHYSIRIQKENENTYQEFRLEAVGCGNTFTNPDYEQCIQDPEKNVYTYLNIENGLSKKMNSFFARRDKTWHIGFQGTKVILNSGDNGPGDTRVTSLYLYRPFYENKSPAFQKLAEESFENKGIRFFELEHDFRNAPYALPAGIDRVIFEDDWLRSSRGIFSANQNSWWLIKNREQSSLTKINIHEITESQLEGHINSLITLRIALNNPLNGEFQDEVFYTLPEISSKDKLIKMCIDLNSQAVVDCKNKNADLIFSALNIGRRRSWRFNVTEGAVGPLSYDEISNY